MLHMGVAGTQTQFCVAVFTSRHRLDDHLVWLQLIPGSRPRTQLSQAEAVKSWLFSPLSIGSDGFGTRDHRAVLLLLTCSVAGKELQCIFISVFPPKHCYLYWETHIAWQWVQTWCWGCFMVISQGMVVTELPRKPWLVLSSPKYFTDFSAPFD